MSRSRLNRDSNTSRRGKKSNQNEMSRWSKFIIDQHEKLADLKDEVTFYDYNEKVVKYSKNSLGLFSNRNIARVIAVKIITHPRFNQFILLLILLNSLAMGCKSYTDPENWRDKWVEKIDPFFSTCFIIEAILKIFAQGFIMGSYTYLADGWNWLDFIVVLSTLAEIFDIGGGGLSVIRLIRPLKSLR